MPGAASGTLSSEPTFGILRKTLFLDVRLCSSTSPPRVTVICDQLASVHCWLRLCGKRSDQLLRPEGNACVTCYVVVVAISAAFGAGTEALEEDATIGSVALGATKGAATGVIGGGFSAAYKAAGLGYYGINYAIREAAAALSQYPMNAVISSDMTTKRRDEAAISAGVGVIGGGVASKATRFVGDFFSELYGTVFGGLTEFVVSQGNSQESKGSGSSGLTSEYTANDFK